MKNKNKSQFGMGKVGEMLIILIVVIVVIFMFKRVAQGATTSTGQINMRQSYEFCKLNSEKFREDGKEVPEPLEGGITFKGRSKPGDGFLDTCDLCLGGDDNKMTNSYWIPDDCFVDPDKGYKDQEIKSYKQMCKIRGGTEARFCSKSNRCCLLGSKCPSQCKK